MKPEPGKKNLSLLWFLGAGTVAVATATLFSRTRRSLTDEEFLIKEKEFFDKLPGLIDDLRKALPEIADERRGEMEELLEDYERKQRVMEGAFELFPENLEYRRLHYDLERSWAELERGMKE